MSKDLLLFIGYIVLFLTVSYIATPFSFDKVNPEKEINNLIAENGILQSNFPAQASPVLQNQYQNKRQEYIDAIKYGALWFYNNQNNNFLNYEYDPLNDSYVEGKEELREVASLWAIAKAANFTNRVEFKNLAQKGFAYFEKYFKYDKEKDFYYLNITPGSTKLGYSGFIILSLLEIDHPKKDFYLEKFADGIIYQQKPDGSLATHFYSDKVSNVDYYPGEALIAIAKLYEYKPEQKYLDLLNKAFSYYKKYWQENKNTPFIPWQTRAYNKLYKFTNSQEVADFIFEMNDYLITYQPKYNSCSDFVFNQGIIIAVRMEGMNQAYEIAKMIGDKQREQCYGQYIKEGADYIMSLQVKKSPLVKIKALGGFGQNKDFPLQRIDRNQHAIMALMEAIELGILQ